MDIITLILTSLGIDNAVATAVFVALFSISEALSFIPSIKANGVFQAIYNILKKIVKR